MEVVQARDIEKALDAFTRAVQLDPQNGEAWNNIACLYEVLAFFLYSKVGNSFVCSSMSSFSCKATQLFKSIFRFLGPSESGLHNKEKIISLPQISPNTLPVGFKVEISSLEYLLLYHC